MAKQLPSAPRILVLEDDPDVLDLYHMLLNQQGYVVYRTSTLNEARSLLRSHNFDLFLSDVIVGDGRGTDLLRDLMPRLRANDTRIVLVSGASRYHLLSDEVGADLFVTKPIEVDSFLALIARLLHPSEYATL